ncbi:gamma-glutamyltranspeptidase [Apodospora peruviana]|uniref:Glutathione hydrolase n=1 Tax=Apodospora peruviana TaxID=516989 RepID=A0AAE0HYC2_9PEZI|nr:gamma-glutamyltranspeptidase [Apodospora peruviana]
MRHSSLLICWLSMLSRLGLGAAAPIQNVMMAGAGGSKGAVASESFICSRIGVNMIEMGGTAADAMVATELCVGVIGMYHSGIGGGGFMLVRDKNGRYETIDYRESAPAAAHRDMYKDDPKSSVTGALSVAIPGELRGLEYLHKKYGVLPWRTLVGPSVRIARNGFEVTEDLVRYMKAASQTSAFLTKDSIWAEDFAPNGTLVKLGDVITRKRFADSLEKIANKGADEFYEGELANSMIDYIQSLNGTMTLDDLKNYTVKIKQPLSISYRDYRLFTTSAPSSGAVMLSILKTMEQYPSADLQNVNLTTHRFVEAMKFAYGARQELGDPDYIGNITEYQEQMMSDDKAKETRKLIMDNQTQPIEVYDPLSLYAVDSKGTSHIVTADRSGLTVSTTTTINLLFGAQIMTPDTGIILNDEMDDFSQPGRRNSFGFEPSPANFIAPGKRPLSSITPLMVDHAGNGTLFFATGAAGGSRIISATTEVAWNLMELGMSIHDAIAAPRLHDQLMPDMLLLEEEFDENVLLSLKEKKHNVTMMAPGASAAQGIVRLWDGRFDAAGETRQKNSAGLVV